MIFRRSLQGIAQRANGARHDRDLVDRVHVRQVAGRQGMAHFVVGHHLAFIGVQQAALAFDPGNDAFHRRGEIVEAHRFGTASSGDDGRLVDQVGQVCSGKTGGDVGDTLAIEVLAGDDFLKVDLEDRLAAFTVGAIDQDLAGRSGRLATAPGPVPRGGWSPRAARHPHAGRTHRALTAIG